MEKPAPADHPIHDLLRARWSPRAFDPRPLSPAHFATILEAARWAASSSNEQPWRFVVAARDDEAGFAALVECLVPGNRIWAERAGALVLTVAQLQFSRNGKPNPHAWHDCGIALGQMLLQAAALGIGAHAMAGFDAETARRNCAIPADFAPVSMTALGYPGPVAALSPELQAREAAPRTRRPLPQSVFAGSWDRPAAFLS